MLFDLSVFHKSLNTVCAKPHLDIFTVNLNSYFLQIGFKSTHGLLSSFFPTFTGDSPAVGALPSMNCPFSAIVANVCHGVDYTI